MGSLKFDGNRVEFDDRTLAHLQIAVVHRLRRQESVLVSWLDALGDGDGRSAVFLHPTLPISFDFDRAEITGIDREWVQRLLADAGGRSGVVMQDVDGRPIRALHSTTQY